MTAPQLQAGPAPGRWARRRGWAITSVADAMRVREAVRSIVAAATPGVGTPGAPFFASAAARAETAAGELLLNGLDHGTGPVYATLSRGDGAWLLAVTDTAPGQPPAVSGEVPDRPGGLGLRLTLAVSDVAGWSAQGATKTVWAQLGDRAPTRLMESLSPQNG